MKKDIHPQFKVTEADLIDIKGRLFHHTEDFFMGIGIFMFLDFNGTNHMHLGQETE